jgi:outer membrane receptor for ferrienterochelin and colicins
MNTYSKMLFALILFCWGSTAYAQNTGSITGTVTDAESGELLFGVNVIIDGTQRGVSTNFEGKFKLQNLDPGSYDVKVSYIGYGTKVIEDVAVSAGSATNVDVELKQTAVIGDELVVTGSKQPEKLLDAPMTIERIDLENISTSSGGTYLSALANVQGVDFVSAGINAQGISARGFNSQFNTRMLYMVDGRMAQLPGTGLPQGNFSTNAELDVKSIEVVLGPASALYGPNAHTGVVNVITKTPWDRDAVDVKVRGGQQDLIDVGGRIAHVFNDKFGVKANFSYMKATDFKPLRENGTHFYSGIYEGDLVDNYDISSTKFDLAAYYRFADWQVKASYGYSINDNFGLTNNGRNRILGWAVNYQTFQVNNSHWYFQATRTANDAGDTYQINGVASSAAVQMATTGQSLDQLDFQALREANGFTDKGQMYDSEIQYRNTLFGAKFVTGLQYRLYKPNSEGTFLADANGEDLDATEFGGYLQLDYDIIPDRLRAVAAARVDNHSNYDTQFSPKGTLVFTPVSGHNIRVGYNRAFKSPTVLENNLYIPILAAQGYYLNALGNINGYILKDGAGNQIGTIDPLSPEEVNSIEVGYKGVFDQKLLVDFVAYNSWYNNFISPLTLVADGINAVPYYSDGTPVQADGSVLNGLLTYINFGKAQVQGIDAGFNYLFSPKINVGLNASFIKLNSFDVDANSMFGQELPLNVPETKFKGNVTLTDVATPGTIFSLSGRWTSAYKFTSGFWDSTVKDGNGNYTMFDNGEVPSRFMVDLTLGYEIPNTGAQVKAEVSNLFDSSGIDVLGAPQRGRFVTFSVRYGLPFDK